ncbi:MAG: DUF1697 domain-containing protein [Mycobacteriales bacterium]
MTLWVALPRAINLGSHNKVPMPALRDVLTAAGCTDVRTYVQSGNIVFRTPLRSAAAVRKLVVGILAREFTVTTSAAVRTAAQIDAVIAANPFPDATAERPKVVQVTFLDAQPIPAAAAALRELPVATERTELIGAELYVDYGESIHASKLTPDRLRRVLRVDGTARNWTTVSAIAALLPG